MKLDPNATGVWMVETTTAVYALYLDGGEIVRYPSEPPEGWVTADLRTDGIAIKLLELYHCEVGCPMALLLAIRDDGLPTHRLTTPVRSITRCGD